MKWDSETWWQHFIPQVEQRLNAINPLAEPENQKIYPFEIVNREAHQLRLLKPKGQRISKALAYRDLFSFDVDQDKKIRKNFENAFIRYESSVKALTESLLRKLTSGQRGMNVNEEIVNLFTPKLLNMARNPFAICKTLNTFGTLTNYVPAKPEDQITLEQILNGRKPHQERLCQELGITDAEYKTWLGILFMLFIPSGDGELNMLESMVKDTFINHEHEIVIFVGLYNDPCCLLSDRSFSTNTDKAGTDGFDFNLSSRAFIRYLFIDLDVAVLPNTPPHILEIRKNALKGLPRPIQLYSDLDNKELLSTFNRNVVYQSHSHVYCASPTPFIV